MGPFESSVVGGGFCSNRGSGTSSIDFFRGAVKRWGWRLGAVPFAISTCCWNVDFEVVVIDIQRVYNGVAENVSIVTLTRAPKSHRRFVIDVPRRLHVYPNASIPEDFVINWRFLGPLTSTGELSVGLSGFPWRTRRRTRCVECTG